MGQVKAYTYAEHDGEKQICTVCHSNYKDNRFLPKSEIVTLESYKNTDPYYYMVYAMGLWGILGKTVFNKENVTRRMAEVSSKKPLKQGYFYYEYTNEKIVDLSIMWRNDNSGCIKIYTDVDKSSAYVAGGDTAGDGSDNFTGHFLDIGTEEQVAVLTIDTDENEYVRQMYCLGKYYNNALFGIECNFSTYPVKELLRFGYKKQFSRVTEDNYLETVESKFGFKTDKKTRPLAISGLVTISNENIESINDMETLKEMLTFVRNPDKKGRMEAEGGAHDDHVMGLAIAYYVLQSGQQSYYEAQRRIDYSKLQSMGHDYYDEFMSANKENKVMLADRWNLWR